MGIAHQHEGQLTSVVKNKVLSNLQFKVRSDLLWEIMTSSGASNEVKRYRIVVLGDGGVGKSALTLQYVQHNFTDYHDPTIEDAYQQRTVIDTEPCLLDILDTAGQVEFTAMREQYMRGGEGFIICYSITDRHSFMEAEEYRSLILKVSQLLLLLFCQIVYIFVVL